MGKAGASSVRPIMVSSPFCHEVPELKMLLLSMLYNGDAILEPVKRHTDTVVTWGFNQATQNFLPDRDWTKREYTKQDGFRFALRFEKCNEYGYV